MLLTSAFCREGRKNNSPVSRTLCQIEMLCLFNALSNDWKSQLVNKFHDALKGFRIASAIRCVDDEASIQLYDG
jgi:hypothetical protein